MGNVVSVQALFLRMANAADRAGVHVRARSGIGPCTLRILHNLRELRPVRLCSVRPMLDSGGGGSRPACARARGPKGRHR